MAEVVAYLFGQVVIELGAMVIKGAIDSSSRSKRSPRKTSTPSLSTFEIQESRAVLLVSSNIQFGNACERLVNIAFQTSQSFPTLMSTYADIIQYIRTELGKQYPNVDFQIIIGPNKQFGFSVDENHYFAEIAHEKYRLLIFTTEQKPQSKLDTHDTNSRMSLNWK